MSIYRMVIPTDFATGMDMGLALHNAGLLADDGRPVSGTHGTDAMFFEVSDYFAAGRLLSARFGRIRASVTEAPVPDCIITVVGSD